MPGAKVVVAPRVGWVVRVPGTMKLKETADGSTDARDHETEGAAEPAGAEAGAVPVAAGAEVAAAEPEAPAVGAEEAAALFWRA